MSATLPEKINAFSKLTFDEQKKMVLELLDIFKKFGDPFDVIDSYIRTSEKVEYVDLLEIYQTIATSTENNKISEDNMAMEKLQKLKEQFIERKKQEDEEQKITQAEAEKLLFNL